MSQRSEQREALRELLRRVDEVRSLSSRPPVITSNGADDAEILLATATELVDELERSHRQLIETNVQLVSLREVANSMVSSAGAEETTRTVATYLLKAFTFREVFLCLANPTEGYLEGTWAREDETGLTATHPIRISMVGEPGVVSRTVWQNRTITIHDPQFNSPFFVDPQDSLDPVLRELGSYTVVPLQRSRTPDRPDESPDACPANCPFRPGSTSDHLPGPGEEGAWEERRDIHRKRCLDCNRFPVLGIVGVGSVGPGPASIRPR